MRIVALEEHCMFPALVKRIPPEAIAGRGFPAPGSPWSAVGEAATLQELGEPRLRAMDGGGITVQVLSLVGPGSDLLPPEEGPGWAREANDLLARGIAVHPDRYVGLAHLPLRTPEAAADELERAVTQLGFRGALVAGTVDGRFLDDPRFEPVLARAEALDVPLYIHPGIPPQAVRDAYYSDLPGPLGYILSISGWGWHAETAVHILRLALSGALDRHPGLRLVTGHMGEGLTTMMDRFDVMFGPSAAKFLRRSVSQTIVDQVYVSLSGMFTVPPFLALLQTFGADRIVFSVDYPFISNQGADSFLHQLPVSPADREKIAYGNADRLLKLTPGT